MARRGFAVSPAKYATSSKITCPEVTSSLPSDSFASNVYARVLEFLFRVAGVSEIQASHCDLYLLGIGFDETTTFVSKDVKKEAVDDNSDNEMPPPLVPGAAVVPPPVDADCFQVSLCAT